MLIIDYADIQKDNKELEYQFDCLVKVSKSPKRGTRLFFGHGLEAIVTENKGSICTLKFETDG